MVSLFLKPLILSIFSSPQEWILLVIAGFLLFGANRLPELAKSLGKTRKAFKEGLQEWEDETASESGQKKIDVPGSVAALSDIDNEQLAEELRRRKIMS